MNKKIVIPVAAAAVIIAAIAVTLIFIPKTSAPVVDPRPTGTVTPLPVATPQDTPPVDADSYTSDEVMFTEGMSHVVTVGDLTYDCGAEVPPTENSSLRSYVVYYEDAAHEKPAQISCTWEIPGEDQEDFQQQLEDAQIGE